MLLVSANGANWRHLLAPIGANWRNPLAPIGANWRRSVFENRPKICKVSPLAPLAPIWRQLAPIKLRKTNFWLLHIANWRYRQLAPIIGANWRHGGANKRQLAPIWRQLRIANILAPIGANKRQLAPIIGANWRQIGANWRARPKVPHYQRIHCSTLSLTNTTKHGSLSRSLCLPGCSVQMEPIQWYTHILKCLISHLYLAGRLSPAPQVRAGCINRPVFARGVYQEHWYLYKDNFEG